MSGPQSPDLSVWLCGIELRNPIIAASGTFGYGVEFADIVSLNSLGAIVTKGLSIEPMLGNQSPRMIETAAGMLNAIGLQNVGVRAFVEEKLPALRHLTNTPIITNIFGSSVEDYLAVINVLNDAEGIAAYELNVSCPNTKHGGMVFGNDPHLLEEIVARTKPAAARPLIVKLSPNVTSIAHMAHVAAEAGAEALSVANTFIAMAIDSVSRTPRLRNVTGGLSGPAIKPISLRMVYDAARAVKVPILGIGGIVAGSDVVEYLLAGATAVQVGTANYADPRATENILKQLKSWCTRNQVSQLSDLTGKLDTSSS
jgi:dihydroorotate dehydrogenase (NAD+) catalytic subunit